MEKDKIKGIIIDILKNKQIKIDKIILFGSRARGDFKENSDWDILIVIKTPLSRNEKSELAYVIRKRLADELIPCDVLIKSDKEVKERKNIVGSVIKMAIKEGILL